MHEFNDKQWENDKAAAIQWARDLMDRDDWIILDTETTGLDDRAEIVQVGCITGHGNVLIDNVLVKPAHPIPAGATAVHHITDADVADKTTFKELWPRLAGLVAVNEVVIYNADYDTRLIRQSARLFGLDVPAYRYSCAMLKYAAFLGDWNDYFGNYRWPKLQGGDHSAVGDCKATLTVIERMAYTAFKELGPFVPRAGVPLVEPTTPAQVRLL